MTEAKALAYVKDHVFTVVMRDKWRHDLSQLTDGEYQLTVKRKGRRSNPQNRYYWGVVVMMLTVEFKRLGNEVDEDTTHEFLKQKFNPKTLHDQDGTVIQTVGGSTAEFNKFEMMEYLDKIVIWASTTLSLPIPPPNHYYDINEM